MYSVHVSIDLFPQNQRSGQHGTEPFFLLEGKMAQQHKMGCRKYGGVSGRPKKGNRLQKFYLVRCAVVDVVLHDD